MNNEIEIETVFGSKIFVKPINIVDVSKKTTPSMKEHYFIVISLGDETTSIPVKREFLEAIVKADYLCGEPNPIFGRSV